MSDVCVIGHVTLESVVIGEHRSDFTVGGTGFFSSIAYQRLGLATTLVTRIAETDQKTLLKHIEQIGVSVRCLPSRETLRFKNVYPSSNPNLRTQTILAIADPLTTDDLADISASIFHFGPLVAGDIEPTVFAELAGRGTVAVDVQGMLRRRRQGKVTWNMTREIRHMMRFVDVLKADADEAKFLTGCNSTRDALTELGNWGPREILITTGSHGSYIFDSGKIWSIPALKPEIVLDPTGCGDTYLSGYIAARSRGFEAQRSAYIGAAAASYKLEYSGPLQESFNELCKRIDTDSSVITSVGASPNSSGN